jgi:hypothetical protein
VSRSIAVALFVLGLSAVAWVALLVATGWVAFAVPAFICAVLDVLVAYLSPAGPWSHGASDQGINRVDPNRVALDAMAGRRPDWASAVGRPGRYEMIALVGAVLGGIVLLAMVVSLLLGGLLLG